MAHGSKPSVCYWKSKRAYGCSIAGDQHFLARGSDDAPSGPTYLEALDKFRKLVAQDDGKGTDDYLVSALFNQYRAPEGHPQEQRVRRVRGDGQGLRHRIRHQASEGTEALRLRPLARRQTQWNPTSKAHAVTLVLAAVSWTQKKGFIATNPLAGRIERPQPILHSRDARMAEELMDLLIAECSAWLTSSATSSSWPSTPTSVTGPMASCCWGTYASCSPSSTGATSTRPLCCQHGEQYGFWPDGGRVADVAISGGIAAAGGGVAAERPVVVGVGGVELPEPQRGADGVPALSPTRVADHQQPGRVAGGGVQCVHEESAEILDSPGQRGGDLAMAGGGAE